MDTCGIRNARVVVDMENLKGKLSGFSESAKDIVMGCLMVQVCVQPAPLNMVSECPLLTPGAEDTKPQPGPTI